MEMWQVVTTILGLAVIFEAIGLLLILKAVRIMWKDVYR